MKFLRIGQVTQLTGLSRMTIYRLELAGEFPKRRRLSKNSVAWLDTDITQWGGVATGQSTQRNSVTACALGRCDLRLNQAIPGNLARDRPSPYLGGHVQGYLRTCFRENAAGLKHLRCFDHCNPGSHSPVNQGVSTGPPLARSREQKLDKSVSCARDVPGVIRQPTEATSTRRACSPERTICKGARVPHGYMRCVVAGKPECLWDRSVSVEAKGAREKC